mmetsp:Transcript_1861/g.2529  ORF Transcript_1861/g.2529 Transcript_1861/m.2529 type:complete len:271 (+) Transcript_1861:401-1213(+)
MDLIRNRMQAHVRSKTMQIAPPTQLQSSPDKFQKVAKNNWVSHALVGYYFITSLFFIWFLWWASKDTLGLTYGNTELDEIKGEIAKDADLSKTDKATLTKTLSDFSDGLSLGMVHHGLMVGAFAYTIVVLVISVIVFLASMSEGRDMIAFAIINLFLVRIVLLPTTVYFLLNSYFMFQNLEEVQGSSEVKYKPLDDLMASSISTCDSLWESYCICIAIMTVEIVLTSIGSILSLIRNRMVTSEEPVYVISSDMLRNGTVAQTNSYTAPKM